MHFVGGGVDHDVPGHFDDSDKDFYGFHPHALHYRFITYSNPHPGAPTLRNPLGVGPPSDLHRRNSDPQPVLQPQQNLDQQLGAIAAGPAYYVLHPQKGITICLFLTYQAFKNREGVVSQTNLAE